MIGPMCQPRHVALQVHPHCEKCCLVSTPSAALYRQSSVPCAHVSTSNYPSSALISTENFPAVVNLYHSKLQYSPIAFLILFKDLFPVCCLTSDKPWRWYKGSGPLSIRPIVCPETLARNYNYSLRNNPEERRDHLPSGGRLKSRIDLFDVFLSSVNKMM